MLPNVYFLLLMGAGVFKLFVSKYFVSFLRATRDLKKSIFELRPVSIGVVRGLGYFLTSRVFGVSVQNISFMCSVRKNRKIL